jgi:hypothetical protein
MSKNEVLCAAAGRLAAESSEADKPVIIHSLFQLRILNFSCGPKNKNPKELNRGIGDAIVLEPVSH